MPWLYVKRQGIEAQRASCCSQWWSDSSVVHSQPVVEIHTPYIWSYWRLFVCWGSTVWGTGLFCEDCSSPCEGEIFYTTTQKKIGWKGDCELMCSAKHELCLRCIHTVEMDLMFISDGPCSLHITFRVSRCCDRWKRAGAPQLCLLGYNVLKNFFLDDQVFSFSPSFRFKKKKSLKRSQGVQLNVVYFKMIEVLVAVIVGNSLSCEDSHWCLLCQQYFFFAAVVCLMRKFVVYVCNLRL